jgi:hypothetical protein
MKVEVIRTTIWLVCLTVWVGQDLRAQSAASDLPPGLPPVIESLGAGDPPDLPPDSNSVNSAPPVDQVTPPYYRKPVERPNGERSGSVLDRLDNLPPVGSEATKPQPPGLPDAIPGGAGDASSTAAGESPRVVRFGDVRTESAARQLFPELRNRTAQSSRDRADTPKQATRVSNPDPKSRGFFSRLMPWRKQQTEEPPLVVSNRNEALNNDRIASSGGDASLPSTRNRAIADRIDQELQKKVDRAARQTVGSKTNELDVQVVDEEIYIRARPMWFWQRRQITDELRNLPGFDAKRLHVTVY